MKSSKDLMRLFEIDYTELYIPEINIPKNLKDNLLRALADSDAAGGKYYREEILAYCYSACIEKAELKEMEKSIARREGKKHGAKVSKDILDRQREWQFNADKVWSHRPNLSINEVAKIIAGDEDQSWHTIKKSVKKNNSKS